MTGKNIQLTVFIILAAACIAGSVYLFWFYGHFNFWLFLGAWIFGVIGVLTYYSEKSEHEHYDPYAHDHEHGHGHGHDAPHH
jgi:purine-cytosine permease-like protein